jgi:hypothetical protein
MKRIFLYLIFIGFINLNLPAQSFELQWEDSPLQDKNKNEPAIVGKDPLTNAFYLMDKQNGDYILTKVDDQNAKVFDKKINFENIKEIKGNKFSIFKVVMLKDRFLAILFVNDKSTSISKILIQGISFEGECIGELKSIYEVAFKTKLNCVVSRSPDSNRVAVCIGIFKQPEINENKLILNVYNYKLEEIMSKKLLFSEEENNNYKKISIYKILLTNSNQVVLLGQKLKRKTSEAWWIVEEASDNLIPIKFDSKGNKLKISSILINKLDEIEFIGFYKGPKDKIGSKYEGYYYGKVNIINHSIDNLKMVSIPSDAQKPPYENYGKTFNFILKNDGGKLLIMEYHWKVKNSSDQYYGNLLIVDITNDGDLNYCTSLVKNQLNKNSTSENSYYSYLPLMNKTNNNLIILFNDDINNSQNLNNAKVHTLSNINNRILESVEIDEHGNKLKTPVILTNNKDVILNTNQCISTEDNKKIVLGEKDGKIWVGTLTIK